MNSHAVDAKITQGEKSGASTLVATVSGCSCKQDDPSETIIIVIVVTYGILYVVAINESSRSSDSRSTMVASIASSKVTLKSK